MNRASVVIVVLAASSIPPTWGVFREATSTCQTLPSFAISTSI